MKARKSCKLLPVMQMENDARLGRKGLHPILEILIFFAVFEVANMAQAIPLAIVMIAALFLAPSFMDGLNAILEGNASMNDYIMEITESVTAKVMLPSLFFTALTIVVVFIYCTKIEKRPLRSLGFRKKHAVVEYLVGLVIGAALFSLAVLICVMTGSLSIAFVASGVTALIPVFFLGFLIQGASEEILCRGYFTISYSRKSSMVAAILLNSGLFAALHLMNPGISLLAILNLMLFGIFASVYFLKRGNIWGVCAIHSIWNFVQGNVFGIQVSGMTSLPSIFTATASEGTVNTLWNGGAFGLEGGLAVTIVLTIATVLMLVLPAKKSELAPVVPEETAIPEAEPKTEVETATDNDDSISHLD